MIVKDLEKEGVSLIFQFANGFTVQAIAKGREGIFAHYYPSGSAGREPLHKLEKTPGVGLIDEDFVDALHYVASFERREAGLTGPLAAPEPAKVAELRQTIEAEKPPQVAEEFEDAGEWSAPEEEPAGIVEALGSAVAEGDAFIRDVQLDAQMREQMHNMGYTEAELTRAHDPRVLKLAGYGIIMDAATPLPALNDADTAAAMALMAELGSGPVEVNGVWVALVPAVQAAPEPEEEAPSWEEPEPEAEQPANDLPPWPTNWP